MAPDLLQQPADRIEPERLHAAFESAFADYLTGPFRLTLADWPAFLARQAIDPRLGRVALRQERIVAFAFVARRDDRHWRLATMGALPEARGTGAAPALLDELIARAARSGVEELELEVFAQNERALRLYLGRGFAVQHELHGYTLASARSRDDDGSAFDSVDRATAMAWLHGAMARIPHLPLQVTPACLANLATPLQAWQSGQAQLVFGVAAGPDAASPPTVRIHSLVDHDTAGQQGALALMTALGRRHAGHTITVPQLQRLDVGGQALRALGFAAAPLHQVLMTLSPPSSP